MVVQQREGGEGGGVIKLVNDHLDLEEPAVVPLVVDKERELMLMQEATHVKSAHVQQLLYRLKVAQAIIKC